MTRITHSGENLAKKLENVQILIIDNSLQVTNLLRDMLADLGFIRVHSAQNVLEGVQFMREKPINLILTNWELKVSRAKAGEANAAQAEVMNLSGVDFVKRLRLSPSSPNPYIPIVIFADALETVQIHNARDAGVNEVCIKPLTAGKLGDVLKDIIDKPRIFILAPTYKGPCRRRKNDALPEGQQNRRVKEMRVIKHDERK